VGYDLPARGRESPAPAPQGEVGGHLLARDCKSPAPFIPRPPKRKKTKGLQRKRKASSYNYDDAKEALGLDARSHHFEVYSAAASSTALPLVETPLINSPTKEEVKAENKILKDSAAAYKRKILTLESINETTARKAERLHVRVCLLSESLKSEKKKSRVAIEQLLILTATQHRELMSKFQEKIQDVHTEHDRAMFMLHGARRRDLLNNQKSVERLQKEHSALVTKLESDYRKDLTKMENHHNKSMVCARHICFFLLGDKHMHSCLMRIYDLHCFFLRLYLLGSASEEDGRSRQYI
jgi:hypothetical protein